MIGTGMSIKQHLNNQHLLSRRSRLPEFGRLGPNSTASLIDWTPIVCLWSRFGTFVSKMSILQGGRLILYK